MDRLLAGFADELVKLSEDKGPLAMYGKMVWGEKTPKRVGGFSTQGAAAAEPKPTTPFGRWKANQKKQARFTAMVQRSDRQLARDRARKEADWRQYNQP